ncbi:MAG: hypothetical protein Kow0074_17070 [Candidatus Zixiibacteriota bacterium]
MLLVWLAAGLLSPSLSAAQTWVAIGDGMELASFNSGRDAPVGDSTIVILRVDPTRREIRLLSDAEQ